jgi:hypothetical protein
MTWVVKINGEREEFDKTKIFHTCKRTGVSDQVANKIADEVEAAIYDGITTKKILDMVLKKLKQEHPKHSQRYGLREAVAKLDPEEHEFEKYVSHLWEGHGYKTKWDQIVQGECIEHQIDVVAEKDGKRYLLECKHHTNPHRWCGLGTMLQVWAVIDDVRKGYEKDKANEGYENIWLITNTKFSAHAVRYANAKGIILTGWNYPDGNDLRGMIDAKDMDPIDMIDMPEPVRKKFSKAGIILLKDLLRLPFDELYGKTKIDRKTLRDIVYKAKEILNKPTSPKAPQ